MLVNSIYSLRQQRKIGSFESEREENKYCSKLLFVEFKELYIKLELSH